MKFISAVFLSVFLAIACIAKPAVEELIFRYAPSFYDETAITLERHPDGKIFCSVSSRPECSDEQGKRPWTKLKEMEITTDVFAQISSAYEDPELQIAAEKTRDSGLDGSTWTFWKKKGSQAGRFASARYRDHRASSSSRFKRSSWT